MKLIALNPIFSKTKLLMAVFMLATLSIFSMCATAADASKAQVDRFNHMTTGFPLTGIHLLTECSSCHVEGIFKGTPRDCAGCHTKGRRIIATPMSAKHIATTEECNVCHTNAVTFVGTRYNHGRAIPGQCTTCHNGLVAPGRPASHNAGVKLTNSCDSCHRTFVWLPASFNHIGAPQTCTNCHNGATATARPTSNHAKDGRLTYQCGSCHTYFGWLPASYGHADANYVGLCTACHDYSTGKNYTPIKAGHINTNGSECSACHNKISWAGASGAAPANHTSFANGVPCATCHTVSYTTHDRTLSHQNFTIASSCGSCHLSSASIRFSISLNTKSPGHEGSGSSLTGCTNSCHRSASTYSRW